MTIQRGCKFYCIHYDLVEPRKKQDTSEQSEEEVGHAPIVVLHGGPGIPSNYLRPLQDTIQPSRPILFWDQLGCGKSDRPDDDTVCSINLYVNDLVQLLQEVLGDTPFHLYGQSFGGILAFEYLKRERPQHCLSVVLSSTPTNVRQVEEEVNRLLQQLLTGEGVSEADLGEAFRKKHQVQTDVRPKPLEDAYATAGTIFRGTTAISKYVASLGMMDDDDVSVQTNLPIRTPAMILRGEHDFVTRPCIEEWNNLFQDITIHELQGCAHHGMLEHPEQYGKVLESFWQTHEK